MDIPLQPLRIPTGWDVVWNTLYEVDPDSTLLSEDQRRWLFREQRLLMQRLATHHIVDVGWHPNSDPAGVYLLMLGEGDVDAGKLFEFRTRSRIKLVTELERVLEEVAEGVL